MIVNNVLDLIGNTPIMEIKKIEKELNLQAHLYVKIESHNPGGSIKDRIAYGMIKKLEDEGKLKEGSVLIEPTSGNTGIGIALIGAVKGYKVIIVMPESMSIERRKMITAYGAEVRLTKKEEGMSGSIKEAQRLVKEIPNSYILSQFDNKENPYSHYLSTAREIYQDLKDIDYFVAGIGTGGTITGVGKYLKEQNKNIKIIGVEPLESNVINGGKSGAHLIQGIGAGFIPQNLDLNLVDEVIDIKGLEAVKYAKMLCQKEGLFVGISSGAALAGGIEIAKRKENKDKNIVVILPDNGDRYLSTVLFES